MICLKCRKREVCFLPCGLLSREKGSPKEKRMKGRSIDIVYMDEAADIPWKRLTKTMKRFLKEMKDRRGFVVVPK